MFRYCLLFLFLIAVLLGDALRNSSPNPRTKRALYHPYGHCHSSKLSITVEEQSESDEAKKNVNILQRDSCSNIKSVGKPVTHNFRYYIYGAWMKDPLGIMGAETIFVMKNHEGNELEEFANMDMFKQGVARKKYRLPYSFDGTGAVVYGQYLYYNRANTYYIVKYNLRTEGVEAQISLSSISPRQNSYSWGGYSGVDMAVDEQGLWVLWGSSSNSYRLRASKIDVNGNYKTDTWDLNTERMDNMGNAFVACGVIYTIDQYNSRSTTINFAYDTETGRQWNPNIQFTNRYTYNSMVAYNPREKMLYAWDRKRQVTYPITF